MPRPGGGVKGHGGARAGAGRPRKWTFEYVLKVGQACEVCWRDAEEAARQTERKRLYMEVTDLQSLWDRQRWYQASEGEHSADVETELHALNGTLDDVDTPPRGYRITARPPRGTRKRIIEEIADNVSLPESVVDNFWQAYRRFERELRNSDET